MENGLHSHIWTRDSEEFLIESIRPRRGLWDHRDPMYSKKSVKRQAYSEVAHALKQNFPELVNVSCDQVRAKFNNLRTYFIREYRKVLTTPGGSMKTLPKWELYDAMSFLMDTYDNFPTQSSEKYGVSMLSGDMEENSAENIECVPYGVEGISSSDPLAPESPSPSPAEPPAASAHLGSPQHIKQEEDCDSLHRKHRESVHCMQELQKPQPQIPLRYDAATEAVIACMNYIPESQQHLKAELTERVFILAVDIIKKCNIEIFSGTDTLSHTSASPSHARDMHHLQVKSENSKKRKHDDSEVMQMPNRIGQPQDRSSTSSGGNANYLSQPSTSRHHAVGKAVDSLLDFIPDSYSDLKSKFAVEVFSLIGKLAVEYGAEIEKRKSSTE